MTNPTHVRSGVWTLVPIDAEIEIALIRRKSAGGVRPATTVPHLVLEPWPPHPTSNLCLEIGIHDVGGYNGRRLYEVNNEITVYVSIIHKVK